MEASAISDFAYITWDRSVFRGIASAYCDIPAVLERVGHTVYSEIFPVTEVKVDADEPAVAFLQRNAGAESWWIMDVNTFVCWVEDSVDSRFAGAWAWDFEHRSDIVVAMAFPVGRNRVGETEA